MRLDSGMNPHRNKAWRLLKKWCKLEILPKPCQNSITVKDEYSNIFGYSNIVLRISNIQIQILNF